MGRHDLPNAAPGRGADVSGRVAGDRHRVRRAGRSRRGLGRQHGVDPPALLALLPPGPQARRHHRLHRPGPDEDGPSLDLHLALRPGSDGALALGLLHVIFAKGWEDAEFLAERPRVPTSCGPGRPSGRWSAAAATGLPESAITDLAPRLAEAKSSFIKLGPAPNATPMRARPSGRSCASPPSPERGAIREAAPTCTAQALSGRASAMERPDLRPPGSPTRGDQPGPAGASLWPARTTTTDRSPPCASPTRTQRSCAPTQGRCSPAWPATTFTVVLEQFMTDTAPATRTSCSPPPRSSSTWTS